MTVKSEITSVTKSKVITLLELFFICWKSWEWSRWLRYNPEILTSEVNAKSFSLSEIPTRVQAHGIVASHGSWNDKFSLGYLLDLPCSLPSEIWWSPPWPTTCRIPRCLEHFRIAQSDISTATGRLWFTGDVQLQMHTWSGYESFSKFSVMVVTFGNKSGTAGWRSEVNQVHTIEQNSSRTPKIRPPNWLWANKGPTVRPYHRETQIVPSHRPPKSHRRRSSSNNLTTCTHSSIISSALFFWHRLDNTTQTPPPQHSKPASHPSLSSPLSSSRGLPSHRPKDS